MEFGEVVGHQDESPFGTHCGSASSLEAFEPPVVFGVAERAIIMSASDARSSRSTR